MLTTCASSSPERRRRVAVARRIRLRLPARWCESGARNAPSGAKALQARLSAESPRRWPWVVPPEAHPYSRWRRPFTPSRSLAEAVGNYECLPVVPARCPTVPCAQDSPVSAVVWLDRRFGVVPVAKLSSPPTQLGRACRETSSADGLATLSRQRAHLPLPSPSVTRDRGNRRGAGLLLDRCHASHLGEYDRASVGIGQDQEPGPGCLLRRPNHGKPSRHGVPLAGIGIIDRETHSGAADP